MNSKSSMYTTAKAEPGSGVWMELCVCLCVEVELGWGMGGSLSEGFLGKALGRDVTDNLWLIFPNVQTLNSKNQVMKVYVFTKKFNSLRQNSVLVI